jgi:rhomboid-like protein
VSKKLANRTLEALQAQRLEGTLDLALPLDVARAVPQSQLDICLEWLRVNYPVDEDAAIMARIEREDREAEEKLVRRAEQLGLYKPQSGSYEAELGEENSPYGKSVLKEAREQNEKYLLAEKERKRQKWLEGENEEREKLQRQMEANTSLQQYQESALTEARPRADPNERPYLAWVQKHHIAGTLDHPEALEVTTAQRLVAPALFVLLTLGLCYYFATTYEPPARKDRLWPDIPPAAATVGAIIGANVAITLMWKYIPPSWRLLNRFFVIVPFYPSAPSMIGSTFSHQTWRHLATNMLVLGLMGTRVHDELGRGNFLAIYFASGALGSLASLSRSVLLGYLGMTSLGASAATSGIVAAWCMYHANDKITMWILPHELRETLWTQGWIFLACLIATEVFSMVTPARFLSVFPLSRLTKMDHAAHLGGYFAGAGCGYAVAQRKKAERVQRARDAKWFENIVR